nr:hypothetical protein [Tanacetum cinerariifolium]
MLVPHQAANDVDDVVADDVAADAEPTPPSPTLATTPAPPQQEDKIAQAIEITKLKQMVRKLEKKRKLKVSRLKRLKKVGGGGIAKLDADEDVTLEEVAAVNKDVNAQGRQEESQAQVYHIDLEHADKVLITAAATTINVALSAARRRKGVVIREPEETATLSIIVHSELKSKDIGKGILVEEPKPLKKQAQIEQDKAYARELEAELNKNINWDDLEEEASKALKRKSKSSEQQAAKKQKLDEEVEELKKHLQIVPNDEDDVYTEATPLALKDKIAQAIEITKLKQMVRKLEKKRKLKVSGLKRLKKVGGIAKLDADEDVTLEEVVAVNKDVDAQGRQEESQAQVYHIDLEHADKGLITAAATTINAALSAARRRKGVVIREPEETATLLIIVHS